VAPIELLDSYMVERRPHVRQITAWAIDVGKIACTRDPAVAAQRDAVIRSGEVPPPSIDAPKVSTGILYRTAAGELAPGAGELIPQGEVECDGRTGRFDDVVGWGFTLLARDGDPLSVLSAEQQAFLEDLRCIPVTFGERANATVVAELGSEYETFFAENGVSAVLVRPDFTVFGGVASLEELPALVDDLREQLGVRTPEGATA
jgi:3-(3-hydroxy-phenyl)propionate hydroxylase